MRKQGVFSKSFLGCFYSTKNKRIDFNGQTGLLVFILIAFILPGCGRAPIKPPPKPARYTPLGSIHYIIQAGAFSNIENAVRFTEKLRRRGIDAYHFLHHSGLYKVRFGNFPSRAAAINRAKKLLSERLINDFYIVTPEKCSTADMRGNIIQTADSFIGVPYRWGGESVEEGFDCSGFTMTVYKLNGLDLPRSSQAQWRKGVSVSRNRLKKGDLVFFRTTKSGNISHVGIYAGNGRFIHAPGRGDHVQRTSLNNRYFRTHFTGAKTYFF
jgi:hypothetical protein